MDQLCRRKYNRGYAERVANRTPALKGRAATNPIDKAAEYFRFRAAGNNLASWVGVYAIVT